MTIRPGRPFWTFIYAFALNMSGLFIVDSVDVFQRPIVIVNWFAAMLLSLIVAVGMYAKAKLDENNGKDKPLES
jgi:hypothetical protein